jgi:hypothetical protein
MSTNEQFLNDVAVRANEINHGSHWIMYLNAIMRSQSLSLVKIIYTGTMSFKLCLKKFIIEDLTMPCNPKEPIFETAYISFKNNLKRTRTVKVLEEDRWLVPHLTEELTAVLAIMDEMIWNTTSKTQFVIEQQNRIIREKGEAFVKHPLYEEIIRWTMHPNHFENGWFEDHGFLDEEGILE